MNIDQSNFSKSLSQILLDLDNCDFIAFDGEFSGLKTIPFASENEFQSQEQFYQRMKDTCINFSLLQLGLCMFEFKDKAYVPKCYNIYLKNNTATKGVNNCVISQVDCLDFLARNKMDLGRVFSKGITNTRLADKAFVEKKCKEGIQELPKEYIFLAQQDQIGVDNLISKLTEFKNGNQKEIIVDFVNKTILNEVKRKVNLQIDKDQKKQLKQFQYVVRQNKNQMKLNKQKGVEIEKKTEEKKPQQIKQEKGNQIKQQQQVKEIKETKKEAEQANIEVSKTEQIQSKQNKKPNKKSSNDELDDRSTVQQRIEDLMGCTLVIEHMIKLKKPIIGHYANLDLGFLYQTFIDELPETFAEFCKALKNLFPFIFDTKVVSKSVQKAMKNLRVDLSSLYDACHDSKLLGPYANIDLDAYEGDEVKHQAGYDAYITGCAFIAMMNFLEVNHDKPEQKPGKQKKPKQQQHKNLLLSALSFQGSPFNCIIYSKASGPVVLNGENTNKFDNRVLIIEGCFKSACAELTKYDSLRLVIKDSIFVKFDHEQNIPAIIQATTSDKFKLIPYSQRKQFRARKYLA